jgi:hypothetical protein
MKASKEDLEELDRLGSVARLVGILWRGSRMRVA